MTRIVVIEDNAHNARMADKLLKRAGYDVILAEDGEMGLTAVFEEHPDLILIDLGLPDIDGQTVIGLVRQHEALKQVPVIAFTAWPPEEAHDMATRYGCDGVITKPLNTRTFAGQIGAFLKGEDGSTGEEVSLDERVAAELSATRASRTRVRTNPASAPEPVEETSAGRTDTGSDTTDQDAVTSDVDVASGYEGKTASNDSEGRDPVA